MRYVIRGFFVTALLAAVAGCGTVGYNGPNLYASQDGYVDKAEVRYGQGVWEGLPCNPRPSYIQAGPAGAMGPGGPADRRGWQDRRVRPASPGLRDRRAPRDLQDRWAARGRRSFLAPDGSWSSVENVQFEFKQAAIQAKCTDKLAKLVTWMNANPKVTVGLDGHVDDAQANDNDPTLSARRVSAVRQALITAGIAPSRISSGAFGARVPLCRTGSDNCLALNRRVEILASLR